MDGDKCNLGRSKIPMKDPCATTQPIELEESEVERNRIQREEAEWAHSTAGIRTMKKDCDPKAHERLVDHVVMVSNQVFDNTTEIRGMNKNIHTLVGAVNEMATGMNDLKTVVVESKTGETITVMGKKIPLRYIVAVVIVGILMGGVIVIEALREDKLEQLADSIQIIRGHAAKAERVESTTAANPNE